AMRDAESRRTSGLAFGQAAQALAAAQAALAAVVSAVAGVSFFNGRSGNVVPEAGDYTAAQVTNAARTNGTNTFTGNQTITKSSPVLALNKTAVAQFASLRGSLNDVLRWDVPLGNDTAEAGSNAGSDFEIASYTDLGAGRAVRARIRRADGYANLFGSLEIGTPGGNNTLLLRRLGTSIGGAADLELPSTGSTLAGNVRQQLTANQWQLIENGGTQRGVRLDLTGCAAAAGSDLVHSGNFATQLAAVLGPALAALAHTDVGIFGFFRETSVTTAAPGTVVSGSGLNWTAVNDATNSVGASPTGQWRRHGQGFSGGCCVFQRWS
ncbi:MAG: hypothetical protein INF05_10910, partial [Methylobacterium sp.]|nr:hypothetical protein [Methylobacterium sp.]